MTDPLRLASTGRWQARQVVRLSVAESSPGSISCAESRFCRASVHPLHPSPRQAVLPCTPLPWPVGRKIGRCIKLCALLWYFFSLATFFGGLSSIVLVKTAIKTLKSNVLAQRSRSISLLKIRSTGAIIVLGTQRAPFISQVQVTLQVLMN